MTLIRIKSTERNELEKKKGRYLSKNELFVLTNGTRIYKVIQTDGGTIYYGDPDESDWKYEKYLYSCDEVYIVPKTHLETIKESTMTSTTLFQTKEVAPRFGTKIAVNSAGLFVLEMKPSGEIECFNEKDLEVVTPYTVSVRPFQNENNSKNSNYCAVKDSVKKGDVLLLDNGQIVIVTALDTKANCNQELKGNKLVTTPINA